MLIKVKGDTIIKYPYGFDDLQEDNPYTLFSGDIDLLSIFNKSDEHLINGADLLEVIVKEKPDLTNSVDVIESITLSDTPVKEGDNWVLNWDIKIAMDN